MWEKGKAALRRLKAAYGILLRYRYTTIAGSLVFFLVTSVVPFVFWLTLLFGDAGIGREELLEWELFGWARELLVFLKENAAGAGSGAGMFFLLTTLWSSTGFFYHLRRSGELIYGCGRVKKGWKVRLSALLYTFALMGFFVLAGGAIAGGVLATHRFGALVGYPVLYTVVLVAGFFAAWLLNSYVCPYRIRPRDTALGSALTALAWLAASAAFSLCLTFTDREKLYGALTLVIVALLWLYWMMLCFTAGVIFNCRRNPKKGAEHKKL